MNNNQTTPEYTTDIDQLIAAERAHINHGDSSSPPAVGLAFSGGGIRSASFALGVTQALVARDKLQQVDYLSTVSGGGYIGSALTWFFSQKIPSWMRRDPSPEGDEYFGTRPDNFPLGQKYSGNRNDGYRFYPNAILDFIRQHATYLTPGKGLNGLAMAAYGLRATAISLSVYLCLLTALMVALQQWGFYQSVEWLSVGPLGLGILAHNVFFALAVVCVAIFALHSVVYSLLTRLQIKATTWQYRFRTFSQRHLGYLLGGILGLLVLGSLAPTHQLLIFLGGEVWRMPASSGAAVLGALGALTQQRRQLDGGSPISDWLVIAAGAVMIYGLGLWAYWLAEVIIQSHSPTWWLTLVMLVVVTVVSTLVNINYLGLHRMYRDRLMETFLPNLANVRNNQWGMATEADHTPLSQLCQHNCRPYHLISANVVLVDSPQTKYRGRGGDNFLLSPLYCGSDATGWRQSAHYMHGGLQQGMDLPTAMAISGAAINPNTGESGRGLTRSRLLSTVLSVLNIRLGFWAPHPNPKKNWGVPPNFLYPAFTGGVIGGGLRETRRAIQLTDGGHFENLALYELIRRRLKVIICTDGGADPHYQFGDLANVVEKARVDFGAVIDFDGGDYCLENLLPGSETDDYFVNKYQGAKNPFAIARIRYADGSSGCLIYIKATLVKGLPADLLGYKTTHPAFPNEPTSDQFFNEPQFEAYRELGYCLGKIVLDANEKEQWL